MKGLPAPVAAILLAACCFGQGNVDYLKRHVDRDAFSWTPVGAAHHGSLAFCGLFGDVQKDRRRDGMMLEGRVCQLGELVPGSVPLERPAGAPGAVPVYVRAKVTRLDALHGDGRLVLYLFPTKQPEAVALCAAEGGELFEPRTPQLRSDTLGQARRDVIPGVPGTVSNWVGLVENPTDEDDLFWISDGSRLVVTVTPGLNPEPDLENNWPTEKCFVASDSLRFPGTRMLFADRRCDHKGRGYPWCRIP